MAIRTREYEKVIERCSRAACAQASGLSRESEYVNRRWPAFKNVATVVYDELIAIDEERFNIHNEDNENDKTSTKDTSTAGTGSAAYDTLRAPPEKGD